MRFCTLSTKVQQSVPQCETIQCGMEKSGKSTKSVKHHQQWLTIITKAYCIDKIYWIWLGFAYLDVKTSICFWYQLFIFVAGTAFLTLVDSAKQAGPMGCSSIFRPNLHLKILFSQVEYLGAYVYVIFLVLVMAFYLAIIMLVHLLPTGGHGLMNIAKLGLVLS